MSACCCEEPQLAPLTSKGLFAHFQTATTDTLTQFRYSTGISWQAVWLSRIGDPFELNIPGSIKLGFKHTHTHTRTLFRSFLTAIPLSIPSHPIPSFELELAGGSLRCPLLTRSHTYTHSCQWDQWYCAFTFMLAGSACTTFGKHSTEFQSTTGRREKVPVLS